MKTIYLDCSRGAAGDMLTAALFGLLPDEEKRAALDEMNAFGIPNTVYRPRKHNKMGIKTIQMTVLIDGEEESEMIYTQKHAAKHSRDYRTLRDVANIIAKLNASETARINAFKVYALLASAESKAHGVPVGEVHFHEVGSLDAIADIMGFCYLVEKLEAKKIVVSPIGVGCGTVECAHGVLSVPTPATAALLKGVPICNTNRKGEMCTPTGAAIIRFFANEYGKAPAMEVKSIAYSSGKRDYDWPNIVRALIGETEDPVVEEEPVAVEEPVAEEPAPEAVAAVAAVETPEAENPEVEAETEEPEETAPETETAEEAPAGIIENIFEYSCNLDDMTAEAIGFAIERLFDAGALDVYTTPIGMKKSRLGIMVSALCREEEREAIRDTFFRHTTTLGLREQEIKRYALERRIEYRSTPFGDVRLKKAEGFGVSKEKFEYEDIAAIAKKTGLGLDEVVKQYCGEHDRLSHMKKESAPVEPTEPAQTEESSEPAETEE
ncbi:MAG: nickel pincer cofactor biosynthesis protein LarC [Mogibacterium sp.]|nr:nickel pincer cofactor biosynthesis protein LarC [Mogibacterium sp.]